MSAHSTLQDLGDAQAEQIIDPGASGTIKIRGRSFGICELVSSTTETRTLPAPVRAGQWIIVSIKTAGGAVTLTVTGGYNANGDTTFVLDAAGEFIVLMSVRTAATTYVWRKIADHGLADIALADSEVLEGLSGLTATAAEINARAAAASRIVNVTNAATYTVLAADSGKIHIMPDFTSSCTLALPAASAGLEYTFIGKAVAADAENWIFQSASATNFYLGGSAFADTDAGAAGDEIHAGVWSNGSSNDFFTVVAPGAGTRVYMICDGTNWIVNAQVFSATVPAFSDT